MAPEGIPRFVVLWGTAGICSGREFGVLKVDGRLRGRGPHARLNLRPVGSVSVTGLVARAVDLSREKSEDLGLVQPELSSLANAKSWVFQPRGQEVTNDQYRFRPGDVIYSDPEVYCISWAEALKRPFRVVQVVTANGVDVEFKLLEAKNGTVADLGVRTVSHDAFIAFLKTGN